MPEHQRGHPRNDALMTRLVADQRGQVRRARFTQLDPRTTRQREEAGHARIMTTGVEQQLLHRGTLPLDPPGDGVNAEDQFCAQRPIPKKVPGCA